MQGVTAICLLLVAGCDSDKPEQSQSSSQPEEKKTLVFFTWEDYIAPELEAKFEEETGIDLQFKYYNTVAEMVDLMKSNSQAYDVVISDGYTSSRMIELKLVRELQKEKLPHFKNLDQDYLSWDFDAGNDYSVPYIVGGTLIAYRADKIEDPGNSWSLLWDSQYKGKVAMIDDKHDAHCAALGKLGHAPESHEESKLVEARKQLLDQAKSVVPRYLDLDLIKDGLISGDIWATNFYSCDSIILEENENIQFMVPEEGVPLWMDTFMIPRDSDASEEAHLFIDFMLRAEIAAENANYLWAATPNRAAMEFVDEDLKADETVYFTKDVLAASGPMGTPTDQVDLILRDGLKEVYDLLRLIAVDAGAVDTNPSE